MTRPMDEPIDQASPQDGPGPLADHCAEMATWHRQGGLIDASHPFVERKRRRRRTQMVLGRRDGEEVRRDVAEVDALATH